MYKLKIVLMMLGRGAVYGAGLGTLFSCAFSVPLLVFIPPIGILFGLGIGLGLGIILGFIAGLITVQFFYPLKNAKRYQVVITLICVTISVISLPIVLLSAWFGHFTLQLGGISLLFSAVALFAGLAFSKWLTAWYIREGQTDVLPASNT